MQMRGDITCDSRRRIIIGRTLATGKATVIPNWGSKDLKLGTVRFAVAQLSLDWTEFEKA